MITILIAIISKESLKMKLPFLSTFFLIKKMSSLELTKNDTIKWNYQIQIMQEMITEKN